MRSSLKSLHLSFIFSSATSFVKASICLPWACNRPLISPKTSFRPPAALEALLVMVLALAAALAS